MVQLKRFPTPLLFCLPDSNKSILMPAPTFLSNSSDSVRICLLGTISFLVSHKVVYAALTVYFTQFALGKACQIGEIFYIFHSFK